ncbi:MAG: hypothetical protein ACC660_06640, partial [Acidimicrobiales bacterium]
MAAGTPRGDTQEPAVTVLEDRVRQVKGPMRELHRDREQALTGRQREILDDLTTVFEDGFRHLTMADL